MVPMNNLCTVRIGSITRAGRVEGDDIVVLDAADVGAVLRTGKQEETGNAIPRVTADLAPLITAPDKVICVGQNYLDHIREMGNEPPAAPTYFAKFSNSLIGARDDMILPPVDVSTHVDWEAELAIVIGSPVRHASSAEALDAVAGYTVLNDGSVRDYQRRTKQFLAGKMFEGLTPVGPVLVPATELGDGSGLTIRASVDGVVKQDSNTDQLCFTVVDIVKDLSAITTLMPGDIIATGTPGGVGAARTPPEWLGDGSIVRCEIEGIGAVENRCVLPG
jgi:acylpyruvate hydrolase